MTTSSIANATLLDWNQQKNILFVHAVQSQEIRNCERVTGKGDRRPKKKKTWIKKRQQKHFIVGSRNPIIKLANVCPCSRARTQRLISPVFFFGCSVVRTQAFLLNLFIRLGISWGSLASYKRTHLQNTCEFLRISAEREIYQTIFTRCGLRCDETPSNKNKTCRRITTTANYSQQTWFAKITGEQRVNREEEDKKTTKKYIRTHLTISCKTTAYIH